MKKVNIKTIEKADKTSIRTKRRKHSILLHSGLTLYYSDIKDAKIFLVKTNDFLTFKLFELNEIYIEVFTHYRRAWFYFDVPQDAAARASSEYIDKCFKLIVDRGHWQNGAVYVFNWLAQIVNGLNVFLNLLSDNHVRHGNYAELRVIETLRARISFLESSVNNWTDKNAEV